MITTLRSLALLPLVATVLVWGMTAEPAAARGHGGHHGHHGHHHHGHHHHGHHGHHHAHHRHHAHHHHAHHGHHHVAHHHHHHNRHHDRHYVHNHGSRTWHNNVWNNGYQGGTWWGNTGSSSSYWYGPNRLPYHYSYYAEYPQLLKWYTQGAPAEYVQQQNINLIDPLTGVQKTTTAPVRSAARTPAASTK